MSSLFFWPIVENKKKLQTGWVSHLDWLGPLILAHDRAKTLDAKLIFTLVVDKFGFWIPSETYLILP